VTTEADKLIIEKNQQGVNSRYYRPGPYSPMESWSGRFVDWYFSSIA
jgi:Rieske 2Fe-2S family protein